MTLQEKIIPHVLVWRGRILAFHCAYLTAGWVGWFMIMTNGFLPSRTSNYSKSTYVLSFNHLCAHMGTYMILIAADQIEIALYNCKQPKTNATRVFHSIQETYFPFRLSTCTFHLYFCSCFKSEMTAQGSKFYYSETHTRLWKFMTEFISSTWERRKFQCKPW